MEPFCFNQLSMFQQLKAFLSPNFYLLVTKFSVGLQTDQQMCLVVRISRFWISHPIFLYYNENQILIYPLLLNYIFQIKKETSLVLSSFSFKCITLTRCVWLRDLKGEGKSLLKSPKQTTVLVISSEESQIAYFWPPALNATDIRLTAIFIKCEKFIWLIPIPTQCRYHTWELFLRGHYFPHKTFCCSKFTWSKFSLLQ